MAKAEKTPVQACSPGSIDRAEVMRNHWRATVKEGVKPEDLLSPAFWAHIANKFTVSDSIEAVAEDMQWVADYIVVDVGPNWARVVMKGKPTEMMTEASEIPLPPGYTAEWKGPALKWCVTRESDSKRIAEKLSDKNTAHLWVRNHINPAKVA